MNNSNSNMMAGEQAILSILKNFDSNLVIYEFCLFLFC